MVENQSTSTFLSGCQGSEKNIKAKADSTVVIVGPRGMPSAKVRDSESWPLVERAKVIKVMLDQEINSWQENHLKIKKIGRILGAIFDLKTLKPAGQT